MSEQKKKGNRSLHIAFAIAVLIGAIILLIATERAARPPDGTAPPTTAPKTGSTTTPPTTSAASPSPGVAPVASVVVEPGPTPTRAFFATPAAPPPAEGRSPLSDRLGSPDSTATDDLRIVSDLITTYVDHFRELPIGNNAEITAALAGDNTRGLAVIPADHASINARGELVDRWNTPLFFHQVGSGTMQIRSAGPDRQMYSADDLVSPGAAADAEENMP